MKTEVETLERLTKLLRVVDHTTKQGEHTPAVVIGIGIGLLWCLGDGVYPPEVVATGLPLRMAGLMEAMDAAYARMKASQQ